MKIHYSFLFVILFMILGMLSDRAWAGETACEKTCYTPEDLVECPRLRQLVLPCPVHCSPGKTPIPGTDGLKHCCWPGQSWKGACTGRPTSCPQGYVLDSNSCELMSCAGGRTRADDHIHCCWPGQTWDRQAQKCSGTPTSCPGLLVVNLITWECVVPPECAPGQERTAASENHCCWRGQEWRDGRCAGRPTSCPHRYWLDDESQNCLMGPICQKGFEYSYATKGNCCRLGQIWEGGQCKGKPDVCPEGYFGGENDCEEGPASCPYGKSWSEATAGHCCWSGQTWQDGVCTGAPICPAGYQMTVARAAGGALESVGCEIASCPGGKIRDDQDRCVDRSDSPSKPASETKLDRTSHRDNHEFLALFSTSGAAYYSWVGKRSYTQASGIPGRYNGADSYSVGAFAWSHAFAYSRRLYFPKSPWSFQVSGFFSYLLLVPTEPRGCSDLSFVGSFGNCNDAPDLVMTYPPPPVGHDIALGGTALARYSFLGLGLTFGVEIYANGPQAKPYALPIGPLLTLFKERSVEFRFGWRPLLGSLYDIEADLILYQAGREGGGHFAASFYYLMKARDTTDPMASLGSKMMITAGMALGFYFSR